MDLLDAQGCSEARSDYSSQVHLLETTARSVLPSDYQDVKVERHRNDWQAAQDLYAHIDNKKGSTKTERLLECRHFAWFVRHEDTGRVKVMSNSCKLRWCPLCAEAKKFTIKSAVREWLKTVNRPKFMTLTVCHSDASLADQVQKLYKSYRLFRQHKFLKKKTRGGIWFFQIKRSEKSGKWHPHLHILLDMDYVDKVALRDDWLITTGDSYIVDIRAVKDSERVLNDVARYCSSPCHLSTFGEPDREVVADVLHGKRLCGRFGNGARCVFKAERPVDFDKWQRVVSWTDCVLNSKADSALRQVLRAWSEGVELPRQQFELISSIYCPKLTLELHPGEQEIENQLTFEGYG